MTNADEREDENDSDEDFKAFRLKRTRNRVASKDKETKMAVKAHPSSPKDSTFCTTPNENKESAENSLKNELLTGTSNECKLINTEDDDLQLSEEED